MAQKKRLGSASKEFVWICDSADSPRELCSSQTPSRVLLRTLCGSVCHLRHRAIATEAHRASTFALLKNGADVVPPQTIVFER